MIVVVVVVVVEAEVVVVVVVVEIVIAFDQKIDGSRKQIVCWNIRIDGNRLQHWSLYSDFFQIFTKKKKKKNHCCSLENKMNCFILIFISARPYDF